MLLFLLLREVHDRKLLKEERFIRYGLEGGVSFHFLLIGTLPPQGEKAQGSHKAQELRKVTGPTGLLPELT